MCRTSSFVTQFLLVRPSIHLIIRVSIVLRICSCFLVAGQHSAPYSATGLTTVRYTFDLRYIGIRRSQSTPVTCRHFSHAAFVLARASVIVSQSDVTREPRYLNIVTFFSGCPSMLIVPSVCSPHSRYSVFATFSRRPYSANRAFYLTVASSSSCLDPLASSTSSA